MRDACVKWDAIHAAMGFGRLSPELRLTLIRSARHTLLL